MTTSAIILLAVAILVLWGGLAASIVALRARPQIASYPPGGDDDAHTATIIEHDT